MCMSVSRPSAPAATSIHACEKISRRRRSTTSANAPAGSASRKIGRLEAVWISETISGDGDNEVISHDAPTFCIQVPTFEASEASQIARKTAWPSGVHIDSCRSWRWRLFGSGAAVGGKAGHSAIYVFQMADRIRNG